MATELCPIGQTLLQKSEAAEENGKMTNMSFFRQFLEHALICDDCGNCISNMFRRMDQYLENHPELCSQLKEKLDKIEQLQLKFLEN